MPVKLKILNEGELKNCPPDKLIKIRLEAVYTGGQDAGDTPANYGWTYKIEDGDESAPVWTKSNKVQMSLPPFYCGNEVKIMVMVTFVDKKAIIAPDNVSFFNFINPVPQLSLENMTSVTVTPQCAVTFKSIEWIDYESYKVIDEKTPLEAGRFYIVQLQVTGLNRKQVEGYIRANSCATPVYGMVSDDGFSYLFFTDRDFLVPKPANGIGRGTGAPLPETDLLLELSYIKDGRKHKFPQNPYRKKLKTSTEKQENTIPTYIQPVVVGEIDIADNNFKLCKYTKIEVTNTSKSKDADIKKEHSFSNRPVFDETRSINVKPVHIIGGASTVQITLKDYNTSRCELKGEHSHKQNHAQLTMYNPQQSKSIPIPDSGVFSFDMEYDYTGYSFLRNIFAGHDKVVQTSRLEADTCRWQKNLEIDLYPDVEYSATITISRQAAAYNTSGMPAAHGIYEKQVAKARKIGWERSMNISDLDVEFSLDWEYKDGTQKDTISQSYEDTIRKIVGFLGKIKEGLDEISGKNAVLKSGKQGLCLPKSSKIPVFLEIDNPAIEIGGSWKFAPDSANQIIRSGQIYVGLKPFIKAKGGIDLIAAATYTSHRVKMCNDFVCALHKTIRREVYIPWARPIILAIEKANSATEKLVHWLSDGRAEYNGNMYFNLYGYGEIDIEALIDFGETEDVEIKSSLAVGLGIELGVKLNIQATVTITGDTPTTVGGELSAEGKAETGVTFTASRGVDFEQGPYLKITGAFNGVTLTVTGSADVFRDNSEKKNSMGWDGGGSYKAVPSSSFLDKKIFLFNNNS